MPLYTQYFTALLLALRNEAGYPSKQSNLIPDNTAETYSILSDGSAEK